VSEGCCGKHNPFDTVKQNGKCEEKKRKEEEKKEKSKPGRRLLGE
jgi:hypothetical protein